MDEMFTDDQVARNISINVRLFLAKAGMRQSDLARATGESDMTISNLCWGKSCGAGPRRRIVPGAGTVSRVAAALDVSMDQLVSSPPANAEEIIEKMSVNARASA